MNHKKLVAQAALWRDQAGYVGKGGIVTIYNGTVQGWCNQLRDANDWLPECVAIDEDERVYRAEGGDTEHGAALWVVCASGR